MATTPYPPIEPMPTAADVRAEAARLWEQYDAWHKARSRAEAQLRRRRARARDSRLPPIYADAINLLAKEICGFEDPTAAIKDKAALFCAVLAGKIE